MPNAKQPQPFEELLRSIAEEQDALFRDELTADHLGAWAAPLCRGHLRDFLANMRDRLAAKPTREQDAWEAHYRREAETYRDVLHRSIHPGDHGLAEAYLKRAAKQAAEMAERAAQEEQEERRIATRRAQLETRAVGTDALARSTSHDHW